MTLSFKKDTGNAFPSKNYWIPILIGVISFSIGAALGPSQNEIDALKDGNQEISEKLNQQNDLLNEDAEKIKTLQTENEELKSKLEEAAPFFSLSENEQEAILNGIQAKAEAEEQRKKEEAEKAKKAAEAKAASGPIYAKMDAQMELSADRKATFSGTSNLPAGTELLISFSLTDDSYHAQTKTVIEEDGSFTTEQFSNRGTPLAYGNYLLEVISGVANIQPPEVKAILGENYGNVKGPLVKGETYGRILKLEKNFTIQ
ncbi:hypothetical protein [Cytobacillus sp. SAFR-174]|uniref:hypothetical protein n=1 Tax=Cytobacillus sp. SAFR-174 TaxID=3436868 RepID=UPI003F8031A1